MPFLLLTLIALVRCRAAVAALIESNLQLTRFRASPQYRVLLEAHAAGGWTAGAFVRLRSSAQVTQRCAGSHYCCCLGTAAPASTCACSPRSLIDACRLRCHAFLASCCVFVGDGLVFAGWLFVASFAVCLHARVM